MTADNNLAFFAWLRSQDDGTGWSEIKAAARDLAIWEGNNGPPESWEEYRSRWCADGLLCALLARREFLSIYPQFREPRERSTP